jgi:hypothetical protein
MAGLVVLNQVGRFANGCCRLYSTKMDYVFCYYRPNNKFPAHVFGGAARNIGNPKICSTDNFAYYHHTKAPEENVALPDNWQLEPARDEDLNDLNSFYDNRSSGLMMQALHLEPGQTECVELVDTYRRIGLKRDRHIFSMRYRDRLCAVFVVNQADLGLNMSDLTNSVTIFVLNDTYLTKELLHSATEAMTHYYQQDDIPILLYPQQAAARLELKSEKTYCLWMYNTNNLDYYFRYLKRFLKFIRL